jgi:DNA polymerase III subunit delta'
MQYDAIKRQERLKKHLQRITESGQISHGYLFEGPAGTGKLTLAKIFAQTLLCKNSQLQPCEVCSSCVKANADNHPDIHVIDLEENTIKRQDIDEIQENIYVKPYESEKKIYIIKDAHKLTVQAANTFLKTLEEPPSDTVIILLTINAHLLIPTIVSRCQLIKAEKESVKAIETLLVNEYHIDSQRARLLSGYSKGILQRAMSIEDGSINTLKLRDEMADIIDTLLSRSHSAVFEYEKYFEQNKDEIDEIIEIMMIWFRDILFFKVGAGERVINADQMALLEKQSLKINRVKCAALYTKLQEAYENVSNNVNYRLAVDHLLFGIQEVKNG